MLFIRDLLPGGEEKLNAVYLEVVNRTNKTVTCLFPKDAESPQTSHI